MDKTSTHEYKRINLAFSDLEFICIRNAAKKVKKLTGTFCKQLILSCIGFRYTENVYHGFNKRNVTQTDLFIQPRDSKGHFISTRRKK